MVLYDKPMTIAFPAKHTGLHKQVWAGALCMVALVLFFAGQIVAQTHVSRPFSVHDEPMSNLGITSCDYYQAFQNGTWAYVCSPLHTVMNAAFVLYGLFVMLSVGLAVQALWPGRRLKSWGLAVAFLGGIELVIVGASPVDRLPVLHNVAGSLALLGLNTSLVLLAAAAFKTNRILAWFTLLCGVAGLTAFIMTFIWPYTWLGYGGWQRVSVCAFACWGVCTGAFWLRGLLNRPRRS